MIQNEANNSLPRVQPPTSSAVVHGAADARAHRSEAAHREVGHISWLKAAEASEETKSGSFLNSGKVKFNFGLFKVIWQHLAERRSEEKKKDYCSLFLHSETNSCEFSNMTSELHFHIPSFIFLLSRSLSSRCEYLSCSVSCFLV